ncbi:MAG: hypothetical protein P0Y52_15160 [Candidatus Brevundimonas phytovorans]|nr:hypothetical protein [Brevundimonas sp.]WEK57857.1 MAG: hypothetical protein P0Y52_15160 [Brevundimonas sp.]
MKPVVHIAVFAVLMAAGTAEAQQRHVRHNAAAGYAQQTYAQRGPLVESRVQTWYSDSGWQGGYGPVETYGYGYGYGGAGQRPPVVVAPYQEPIRHGYGGVTRSMPFGYPVDGYGRYPWTRGGYGQGQYSQGQYQQGYYQHGYAPGGYAQDCRCGPAPQPAYYQPAPVYVSQPPVYVEAPPVYVQPAPVYVEPARVYVSPPPVYVAPADVRIAPAQVEVAPPQVHVEPPRVEAAPPQVHFEQGYYAMPDTPPPPPQRSPTERPYAQEPGERG